MSGWRKISSVVAAVALLSTLTIAGPGRVGAASESSVWVTWNCTGGSCPWGSSASGDAIAWPASMSPISTRLGYTTSAPVYLPASSANGLTISIESGSAAAYAGEPQAGSHNLLGWINSGDSLTVSGLGAGEVLSIQGFAGFGYTLIEGGAPTTTTTLPATTTTTTLPATTTTTTLPATTTTTTLPATTTTAPADPFGPGAAAQYVYWNCTSGPCPWGGAAGGFAAVWLPPAAPVTQRLGYTTSQGVYLPAEQANGLTVAVDSGSATAYAGDPQAGSHRALATIYAGQTYEVTGLGPTEVLSIQSGGSFSFRHTEISPSSTPTTTTTLPATTTTLPGATTTTLPGATTTTTTPPTGTCTDATSCDPVDSYLARWRCTTPGCTTPDWEGAVIDWPEWSAYSTNIRTGYNSREVYSTSGQLLHPYMGSWADGCEVTAVSGLVLIIEWERGRDVWRETYLSPGQTHTINLVGTENNAMIETSNYGGNFRVSLANCEPQPLTPQ